MFKKAVFAAVGLLGMVPAVTNAAIVTFTDRTAFEAYINGAETDNLAGIPGGNQASGMTRADFSWDINSYGCTDNPGQCGDNSAQGMTYDDDYVWTYNDGTFDFNSTIYAFGIDFGAYAATAQVTLNGYVSQLTTTGGFFGIASTDGTGFNSVSYGKNTGYGLFDNVTWATLAVDDTVEEVSEPAALALLGLGLAGFGIARRKRA